MKNFLRLNHLWYIIATFLRKYRFSKNGIIFSAQELWLMIQEVYLSIIICTVGYTLHFSTDFFHGVVAHVCSAWGRHYPPVASLCDSCVMVALVANTLPCYFLMTFNTLISLTPLIQTFISISIYFTFPLIFAAWRFCQHLPL